MKASLIITLLFLITGSSKAQLKDPKADSVLVEYYQTQKFSEAADFLKKAYPEPITNSKIITQLAYTANMAGRLPDAENYYKRLYDQDSTNLSVLYNIAGINMRRGNNAKALTFYKRILNIDSTNYNVYRQLATLCKATGNLSCNMVYLQKANLLNPTNADIAFELSTALVSFSQHQQAEKVIDRALQTDTANLLLLTGKAQVEFALRKYPELIDICKKLISNDAISSQIISYKGIAEFNLRNYKDCIKTFQILDSTNMQNETSYYYLGMSYKALKEDNKAIYYIQKAVTEGISANTDTYYSEIADCYDRLHQPKQAIKAYKRGLTFGEKPLIYYAMGSIYDSNLKDTLSAIKYYKKYLSSNPPMDKQKSYVDFTKQRIVSLHR